MKGVDTMGVLSRRRRNKKRIKYVEALNLLKAYQNDKLKLVGVIDNRLAWSKSISCNCQVPHCGQAIRWEYILENKIDMTRIVAGSTCVWELLDLSKEQIKSFEKVESSIKSFHAMIAWKKDNMDVFLKIKDLKERNLEYFRPFWEELDYGPLDVADTSYIRDLDIDKFIVRQKFSKSTKTSTLVSVVDLTIAPDYQKVLTALDSLLVKFPNNAFYKSLKSFSDKRFLTPNQVFAVKRAMNQEYYRTKVLPNPQLKAEYDNCEKVEVLFVMAVNEGSISIEGKDKDSLGKGVIPACDLVKKYSKQFNLLPNILKSATWAMYRVKYDIFVN